MERISKWNYRNYEVISAEEIKKHFKWKAALCQHPMYMLIDEDRGVPMVGERVAPWGAENADEYVKRVERNLESLALRDDIKINYEFSAYELLRMCNAYPEVYQNIKKAFAERKLGFVNGTYSQPHLQILGSESNWRQFEMGLKIYKNLFGADIKLYVPQETAHHKQLPQILKCFGYDLMVMPFFSAAIDVIEGSFEMTMESYKGFRPVQGADFALAQSLDGTALPVYIGYNEMLDYGSAAGNVDKDLFAEPKLRMTFPDMMEIDEEYYTKVKELHDFVILEDEIRAMLKYTKPSAKIWLYTYWSYIEGVWAEELLRSSRAAEEATVAAEAVMCMNMLKTGQKTDESLVNKWWADILKYQHHDVYWTEVTDLRRKAIDSNLAVKKECEETIRRISESFDKPDDGYISAVNWLPIERRTEIRTKQNISGIVTQQYKNEVFGFCGLLPCGFKSLTLSNENAAPSVKATLPSVIKFGSFEGIVDKTGLLKQISGIEPALKNDILIGEIRCVINGETYDNRNGETEFFDGPVASVISRKSCLKDIGLSETYYFYKNEGYIKAEAEFDFNGNEIGTFWIDNSKINIMIPTSGSQTCHDIPFGYTEAKPDRPIFAINWLHSGGLVYVNGGNVKHSVQDGVIMNVVAWGGNQFDNRMHMGWLNACEKYDIRLYGTHKITYYIILVNKFDGSAVSKRVAEIKTPVYTVDGYCDESLFRLEKNDIAVTSIYSKDGDVYYRGVKLPSNENINGGYADFTIVNEKIKTNKFN